jgi:hypothetical protein
LGISISDFDQSLLTSAATSRLDFSGFLPGNFCFLLSQFLLFPINHQLPNHPLTMNDPQNPIPNSQPPNPLAAMTNPDPTGNGKVARLPKEVRDRINQMMCDGLTYRQIIVALGEAGKHLTEQNLSNWKSGGYTRWLRAQERREDLLFMQEAIMDRVLKKGCPDLSKAAIQMAVTKVFQLLESLPPADMEKTMDSNNFTRLLNALAKLADGEIKCERHELETAEREAKRQRENQAPRLAGLSEETRQEIEEHRFDPPSN